MPTSGRLICFKNTATPIKGDIELSSHKDQIRIENVTMGSSSAAQRSSETASVTQSAIGLTLPYGPWVAEFQQKAYHGQSLGQVVIEELESGIKGSTNTYTSIRKITLEDAYVQSMAVNWHDINSSISLTLDCEKFTLGVNSFGPGGEKIGTWSRTDNYGK